MPINITEVISNKHQQRLINNAEILSNLTEDIKT